MVPTTLHENGESWNNPNLIGRPPTGLIIIMITTVKKILPRYEILDLPIAADHCHQFMGELFLCLLQYAPLLYDEDF